MRALGLAVALCCAGVAAGAPPPTVYRGPCDASAAVALDADHFVVANDENNTLYVYRRDREQPVGSFALAEFLGTAAGEEADIEGAATIGTRVYWITSHGRNSRGKARPSRQRLFATSIVAGAPPALVPVGRPYAGLVRDLDEAPSLRRYRLASAAQRAPEADGGLNIEGLAAAPDGGLMIGLRSPSPDGRALLIPLTNPARVIEGDRAAFGAPIELDLGGLTIRSLELVGSTYVIVGGPAAERGRFVLFRWSGKVEERAVPMAGVDLGDLRPEALFAIPGTNALQLLSDDGGVVIDGQACKRLPAERQTFRSTIVTP